MRYLKWCHVNPAAGLSSLYANDLINIYSDVYECDILNSYLLSPRSPVFIKNANVWLYNNELNSHKYYDYRLGIR